MSISEKRAAKQSKAAKNATEKPLVQAAARLVQGSVLTAVVVTPWAVGGTLPGTMFGIYVALGLAMLGWLVHWLAGRASPFYLPWTAVPLLLGIGLALIQLMPLPDALLPVASPGSAALRQQMIHAGQPPTEEGTVAQPALPPLEQPWPKTISLASSRTQVQLSLLIAVALVFLMSARFFHHKQAMMWLIIVVCANGALFTFFGLVQQLTWNGKLFWVAELMLGGKPFAAFANRNNAGEFLNLSLAAALGWLIWALDQADDYAAYIPDRERSRGMNLLLSIGHALQWRVANINGQQIGALVLAALLAAGVFCTLSRGAVVALVGAAIITVAAAVAVQRKSSGAVVTLGLLVVSIGLVAWLGRGEEVQSRMSTLLQAHPSKERLVHWQFGLQAAGQFWSSGSGLGSYPYVYGFFEKAPRHFLFEHAENQFLEAAVDGGLPGLLLLLAAIGLALAALMRMARQSRHSKERGFVLMGLFALMSLLIQSMVDFGLYQPANALLFALILGALCERGALQRKREPEPHKGENQEKEDRSVAKQRWRSSAIVVPLCLVLWLIGGWHVLRSTAGEWQSFAIRRASADEKKEKNWLEDSIQKLQSALAMYPHDAEKQLQLAELYLQRYGQKAPSMLAGFFQLEPTDPRLAQPTLQHFLVHLLRRQNNQALWDEWQKSDVVQQNLVPARRCLLQANRACPLLPKVQLHLALLEFLHQPDPTEDPRLWWADGWQREKVYIERARTLTPTDAEIAFLAGVLYWNMNEMEPAWNAWRDALALGTTNEHLILDYVLSLDSDVLVNRILPADPSFLLRVAAQRLREPSQAAKRQALAARAKELMDNQGPVVQAFWFIQQGQLQLVEQQYAQAAKSFEKALEIEPDNFAWRFELARIQYEHDMLDDARKHAQICARLAPENPQVYELLRAIHDALLRRHSTPPPNPLLPTTPAVPWTPNLISPQPPRTQNFPKTPSRFPFLKQIKIDLCDACPPAPHFPPKALP